MGFRARAPDTKYLPWQDLSGGRRHCLRALVPASGQPTDVLLLRQADRHCARQRSTPGIFRAPSSFCLPAAALLPPHTQPAGAITDRKVTYPSLGDRQDHALAFTESEHSLTDSTALQETSREGSKDLGPPRA